MPKISFVMGATASGKTHFIEHFFAKKNVDVLNVFDYQQKAYKETGFEKMMPLGVQIRCLTKANDRLLSDIIEKLKCGRDVVAEQTFFKAKRRIVYVDAIREAVDAEIEIYVMCPSNERWQENVRIRKGEEWQGSFEMNTAEIEFPNPREGFDSIYEVSDGDINLRMDPPLNEQFLIDARKQIADEKEQMENEDAKSRKRKALLESMKTRPFWHYCEVCGKREFLTAEEAFRDGWDYPPKMGAFGLLLGPRKCGNCQISDTLFWKIHTSGEIPIVLEGDLNEKELITWKRIKGEPESLLNEEKEDGAEN